LLEVLKGCRGAGVSECESEVVERQCLGAPVTEVTDDGERGTMLFGRQFVFAAASKLHSELVEPERLVLPVDCDWFPRRRRRGQPVRGPKDLRCVRPQPAQHPGVAPTAARQEETSPKEAVACRSPDTLRETLQVLLKGPQIAGGPLERTVGSPQPLLGWVAAQEPERSRRDTYDQQYGEATDQNGAESESRQQSAQQEPQSDERENATA
jgi:hypothetical protein